MGREAGGKVMEGNAKLLGHSIHPMLIVFPLGLLATAVAFDIVYYITANTAFTVVSYWLIVAGIIGGFLAAIFGWFDWFAIPANTRAKTIGLMHGSVNSIVMLLFIGSLYFRSGRSPEPDTTAAAFSFAGALLALVGGWLGGELVERLGVAVHEGANVNAPSSLKTNNAVNRTEPRNR
jgi:uncharacterized membrane protein